MGAGGWLSEAMPCITLGIALLGAGLGVVNTVTHYRRGAVRLRVHPRIERGKNGTLALFVDLVNAGRVPVRIEKVALAPRPANAARLADCLTDENGHPRFPRELGALSKLTIGPVHTAALQAVAQLQPVTVVVHTEDGRRIKARCRSLRQLYAQLQAEAGERP